MAKISFNKLGLKVNQEIKTITFNEQTIEVKQYLPIADKLNLISNVINASHDGVNNFANPIRISVFTTLEIIYAYTNINFTDKQKEDTAKLYDLVISTGLVKEIINNIPEAEYYEIVNGIKECVESIYTYENSFSGILDSLRTDYKNLDFDASAIQQKLADPENMSLLKDILSKLG